MARKPLHLRRIEYAAFDRDDGLWDIEVHLVDVKPFDVPLESGIRPGGTPIHDMSVRVTLNDDLDIVDLAAASSQVAYPGYCDAINPAYRKLVGLNLLKRFRQRLGELLGGVEGCTHMTEMLGMLPTAAIQSRFRKPTDAATKPFQLDHCHALVTSGPAVLRYYPRWHTGPRPDSP